jgi:Wiskott-Aldrich syndrome protein
MGVVAYIEYLGGPDFGVPPRPTPAPPPGGIAVPPIARPPVDPGYGVPTPPDVIWGGRPPSVGVPVYPAHPIVLPPEVSNPPPDVIWPATPEHPIVLPPSPPVLWPPKPPAKPPAGGAPPEVGGGPVYPPELLPPVFPALPIVLPPPGPPAEPGKPGAIVIWAPGHGYIIIPVGEHPPAEGGPAPTPHG